MVRKSARNSSRSSDQTKTESPKRTRSGRNSRRRRGSTSEPEDENREINESTSLTAEQDNDESIKLDNSSVCEDEGETEEKKHKGKSKTKSKSNTETSSQNERVIENENVQVTPESPPNDNADNESNVQNVTEIVNDDQTEERPVERDYRGDSVQEMSAVDTNSTHNDASVCANQNEEETRLEQQTEIPSETVAPETEQIETVASDENKDRSHTPPPIDTRKDHEHREHTPEKLLHNQRSSSRDETEQHDESNSSKPSGKRISLRRMHHEVTKAADEKDKEVRESEGSTRRKITLRRSHGHDASISVKDNTGTEDTNSTTPEKKSLDVETEKNGDSNSAFRQDDSGWASTYEKASSKESEQKVEKPSRRISLKRKSVLDEQTSSSSHKINSEEPNLYIEDHSQRRRHSSASERPESIDKPQKPFRKIKIIRNLSLNNYNTEDNPEGEAAIEKQPKSRNTRWVSELATSVPKVDMELLKTVCSNLQFPSENEVNLESTPPPSRRVSENFGGSAEQKGSAESDAESEKSYGEPQKSEDEADEQIKIESNPSIIALNRKISIVDDTASKMRPPPSPPRNPVSDVLFITNLVRPFTVKQLKELLERTGTIKSDGFWTDRIKSKCFVRYELPEEAEATRNALHGVNWPIGNGKKLMIDYATVEEMEKARCPPVVIPAKKEKTPEKENRKPDLVGAKDHREPLDRKRDGHIREWDAGKEDYHNRRRSRTRSRSRERIRKHIRRSYTPQGDYHTKKRKHDDPAPQKLMDDLFLKTKATPSIYWQPLSPEEIAMKQQQRLVRMEEHKRRLEETRGRRDTTFRGSTFRRR